MEKMEDWWGNLEKLEKLDDELSERLSGNYNSRRWRWCLMFNFLLEVLGLIMIYKSFLLGTSFRVEKFKTKKW